MWQDRSKGYCVFTQYLFLFFTTVLRLIDDPDEEGEAVTACEDKEEGAIQGEPDFIPCDQSTRGIHRHHRIGSGGAALLVNSDAGGVLRLRPRTAKKKA